MYVLVQYIGTSAHRSLLAEKLAQAVYREAEGGGLVCPVNGWMRAGICQLNGRS
jgi:hypothetical protein